MQYNRVLRKGDSDMDWTSGLQRALDYVEEHIIEPILRRGCAGGVFVELSFSARVQRRLRLHPRGVYPPTQAVACRQRACLHGCKGSSTRRYSDCIGYLSKYGIIKGYADNTFRPNDNVSRAEFVAMTVRFNSLFNDVKKGSYTVKYTDVATNYWAYSDVAYAKNAGWLNGYADGTFKGDNAITRAEVVTVVNRATGRKADEGYITKNVSVLNKFTDIRNNSMWYYTDVMEAANTHLANSANNTETWVK